MFVTIKPVLQKMLKGLRKEEEKKINIVKKLNGNKYESINNHFIFYFYFSQFGNSLLHQNLGGTKISLGFDPRPVFLGHGIILIFIFYFVHQIFNVLLQYAGIDFYDLKMS